MRDPVDGYVVCDALIEGPGLVVDAGLVPVPVLPPADGLLRRGKHVEPDPHQGVELVEQLQFQRRVVPVVEGVPAHDVTVFLLHVGGSALRNNTWTRRHYGPALAAVAATDPAFPRPTFHDLRHTAVSLAISSGVNVKVVQRIAGHASATMTLDTYAGLFDDDLHDSAERLNLTLTGLGWK